MLLSVDHLRAPLKASNNHLGGIFGRMEGDAENGGVHLRAGKIRGSFQEFSCGSMIGSAILYPLANAGGLGLKAV